MKRILFLLILIVLISNANLASLEISKSKYHYEHTGSSTPLVISLSSEDKKEKIKGVDIFCIVDVSGSMSGEPLELVKESLKYLVDLMNEQDNFALIQFSDDADLLSNSTQMTSEYKTKILQLVENLRTIGGTNIYSGLEEGLKLIDNDYSSGKRIASMILLSDGADNYGGVETKFKRLLQNSKKDDYIFTLHTVGYGDYHDAELMHDLSIIKDGGYFYIKRLSMVQDVFLEIYGSLSTVNEVNVTLMIQSNYVIDKLLGYDQLYKPSLLNNNTQHYAKLNIIHYLYGKRYDFVVLVDIPKNISHGTEVLNATIPKLNLTAKYLYDGSNNSYAYEVYVKYIIASYYLKAYNAGSYWAENTLNEGYKWIKENYTGNRDWGADFNNSIKEIKNNYYYGIRGLLSKIRELQYSVIGNNYENENSYQKIIIDNSHNIDVSQFEYNKVNSTEIITIEKNINYYYFYLKEGTGIINNMYFLGPGSSIIIYSDNPNEKINITSVSEYIEYYYRKENKTRILSMVDFSHGSQFIIQKDSSYEVYSYIDGTRDITFNVEFLELKINENSENIEHLFEILAYIVTDDDIKKINSTDNYMPTTKVYNGTYDKNLKVGKITIKKEEISQHLSNTLHNYLYVIVRKSLNSKITYQYIKGQLLFFSMDYIYSQIPENYSISSNLEAGQRNPHLYTLTMEKTLGNILRIEFENPGKELDCKILKYQSYSVGSDELYVDNKELNISRLIYNNKKYIDVHQSYYEDKRIDNIIVSIFSNNTGHVASSDISKLSYNLKYSTFSGNRLTNSLVKTKTKVILLGFSKFIFIREVKMYSFFVNFARIRGNIYSIKLIVTIRIKYKVVIAKKTRKLEDSSQIDVKNIECGRVDIDYDNQVKYNCSFQGNEDEIENIEVDKNMTFDNQEVDLFMTPVANLSMENLQKIGENDSFDKKLFILDNCEVIEDGDNNKFNITGEINDNTFNYETLNLTVNSKPGENKNISCDVLKSGENDITLLCNPKEKIEGDFQGSFANLGEENLVINIKSNSTDDIDDDKNDDDINDDDINDEEKEIIKNFKYSKTKDKGLKAGAIVGIILACVAAVIITTIIIFALKGKKKEPEIVANASNSAIRISH